MQGCRHGRRYYLSDNNPLDHALKQAGHHPCQRGAPPASRHRLHRHSALWADPVFGKSNLVYTLVRADGVVQVPLDRGGLYAGEEVEVRLY